MPHRETMQSVTPCVIDVNPTVGHNSRNMNFCMAGNEDEQRRPTVANQASY